MQKIREAILVFILSGSIFFLFFFLIIPNALTQLNAYFFSTTHDGIKNYFTYLYYLAYDSGFHFSGMAYPYGDIITFTDNQPLLVLTLKALQSCGIPVQHLSVGVFNALLILAFPITSTLLYAIFKHYGVRSMFAFFLALAITFLNPQVERLAGHYALAYSFVIPLFWWLDCKWQKSERKLLWSIIITIVVLLLTFVHVYYLAVALLFYLFAGIGHAWAIRADFWGRARVFAFYFLTAVVPMAMFKLFMGMVDVLTDRVAFPFGFTFYRASFRSLFFSSKSPFSSVIPNAIQVGKIDPEGYAYLGVLGLPFALYWLYTVVMSIRTQRSFSFASVNLTHQSSFNAYIVLAFLALMLGAAFPFYMPPFDRLVDWLTPLAQFRSPGRFAWIFYFIFSVYFGLVLYRYSTNRKWNWVVYGIVTLMLFEGVATAKNQLVSLNKITLGAQFFDRKDIELLTQKYGINSTNYCAIIAFPFYSIGNEKAGAGGSNASIVQSMKVSYHFGIPLVNYMMSRTGITRGMEIAELVSHPILPKRYTSVVDGISTRPFLLMAHDSLLSENERAWLPYATFITKIENTSYYQITPSAINRMHTDVQNRLKEHTWYLSQNRYTSDSSSAFFVYHSPVSFSDLEHNREEVMTAEKRITLFEGKLAYPDSVSISFWGRSSDKVYGFPVLIITEYSADGKEVFHYNSHLSQELELYKSCRRVSFEYKIQSPQHSVKIEAAGKRFAIANFCVQPVHTEVLFKDTANTWYWNNFPLTHFFLK